MKCEWNYQPLTPQQRQAAADIDAGTGVGAPIAELLVRRHVGTARQAEQFFAPALADLHDPFLMPGMDKAVHRLNKAMGAKERIMIYGDYDVDGTTAVALVYKYLQNYYSNIEYYIPTRYEEGYGISRKSIDYAAERGIRLVIVLDCGIKAIEEIAYAKSRGIDFIISRLPRHVSGKRGAEFSIAALVSIANLCTANNTIAIITTGPIAKDIALRFHLDRRKTASILDTFSCLVQGIIPYGAQMLIASGLAGISPISIIGNLYYPFCMGTCAILAILLRYPRKYSGEG